MTHANAQGVSADLRRRATTRFAERFPGEGPRVAVSPGRVNLIGEHTDLTTASCCPWPGRAAVLVFRPRADRVLRAHSVAYDETKEVALDTLRAPGANDWLSSSRVSSGPSPQRGSRCAASTGGGRRRADRRRPLVLGRARAGHRAVRSPRPPVRRGTRSHGEARAEGGERVVGTYWGSWTNSSGRPAGSHTSYSTRRSRNEAGPCRPRRDRGHGHRAPVPEAWPQRFDRRRTRWPRSRRRPRGGPCATYR